VKRLTLQTGIDIAVLAPRDALTPSLELPEYDGLTTYGSDVFFLGFPYGSSMPSGTTNNLHPLPFVKKAIVLGQFQAGRQGIARREHGDIDPGLQGQALHLNVFPLLVMPNLDLAFAPGHRTRLRAKNLCTV